MKQQQDLTDIGNEVKAINPRRDSGYSINTLTMTSEKLKGIDSSYIKGILLIHGRTHVDDNTEGIILKFPICVRTRI